MSHRKFWVLGIASILLLSTVSQAHAESDDGNTQIRAGKVSIMRDADGNTQIQTGRVKVQSESPRVSDSARYRTSIRHHRTIRSRSTANSESSIATTIPNSSADSCLDTENTVQRTNSSSSSSNSQINSQTTRIRGNNRTVIQSSTNR